MSPEEVARLHQFREGFTLVDYAEVGLPVFRLTIEAVTTSPRQMPTIQEFVLRSLALGVEHEDEIARMLGLKLDAVQASTNMLVADSFVARQAAPPDRERFRLTDAGQARLEQEQVEELKEEMLVIDYDGIRRLPIRLAGANVLRASELRDQGAVEIRPYPADAPPIAELAIPDVTRVIRRQGGEDFRRTVLALKRIVRRNNVYREAVALVFAADRGSEVQVAFAIDGKLSDLHERAFAEHGGPRKMGFVKALAEGDARRRIEKFAGRELVRAGPSREAVVVARREEQEAEVAVRALRAAAQGVGRNAPAALALRGAEERLEVALHALHSMQVRPIACYEQDELLDEALHSARRSLLITSAGVQPLTVNGYFLRALDKLIEERVDVRIESFLTPATEARGGDHYDPLAELSKRAIHKQIALEKVPRRELYFLFQDDDLAVISNRPFLGEVSRRGGFLRVDGLVARRPEYVRSIRDAFLAQTTTARRRA
jgi:DNA-binding MarR family transcriptional regulator